MDIKVASQVFTACEKSLAALTQLESALLQIEDEAERRELVTALTSVITDVLCSIRGPLVRQFPELEPPADPGEPDDELSKEEATIVAGLQPADLVRIDTVLLEQCANSWRKGARVVMGAMKTLDSELPDLPVALYAQRIATLVQKGRLRSQGNLSYLRFSEVCLP